MKPGDRTNLLFKSIGLNYFTKSEIAFSAWLIIFLADFFKEVIVVFLDVFLEVFLPPLLEAFLELLFLLEADFLLAFLLAVFFVAAFFDAFFFAIFGLLEFVGLNSDYNLTMHLRARKKCRRLTSSQKLPAMEFLLTRSENPAAQPVISK